MWRGANRPQSMWFAMRPQSQAWQSSNTLLRRGFIP